MLRLPEVPSSRRSGGPQPHHSPTGKSFTPDWSRSIVDSQSGCAGFMASLVPKALAPARTLFQETEGGTRVQIGSGAERTEIALHAQSIANKRRTKPTTDDATKGTTTTTADNASSDKGQGQDTTPRCHRPLPAGQRLDDCELYRHSCCGRLAETIWDRHSAPRTAVVVV